MRPKNVAEGKRSYWISHEMLRVHLRFNTQIKKIRSLWSLYRFLRNICQFKNELFLWWPKSDIWSDIITSSAQEEAVWEFTHDSRTAHGLPLLAAHLVLVQRLVFGPRWWSVPVFRTHSTLVSFGHVLMDGHRGVSPVPAAGAGLQHLHQEIYAKAESCGLGWVQGANVHWMIKY